MITENNKIIAEFMGLIPILESDFLGYNYPYKEDSEEFKLLCIYDQAKYSSDWNWLMEVVEKIENLKETFSFEIKKGFVFIHADNRKVELIKHFSYKASKKEAVYDACVDFIKWYNQQK